MANAFTTLSTESASRFDIWDAFWFLILSSLIYSGWMFDDSIGLHPEARISEYLADSARAKGDTKAAIWLYRHSLNCMKRNHERSQFYSWTAASLAKMLSDENRFEEAIPLRSEVLNIRTNVYGRSNIWTTQAMVDLAYVEAASGHFLEAGPLFKEAGVTAKKLGNHRDPTESERAFYLLAHTYARQGHFKEVSSAFSLNEKEGAQESTIAGESMIRRLNTTASLCREYGQVHNADVTCTFLRKLEKEFPIAAEQEVLATQCNRALVLWDQGRLKEAEAANAELVSSYCKKLGEDDAGTQCMKAAHASFMARLGKIKEAEVIKDSVQGYLKKMSPSLRECNYSLLHNQAVLCSLLGHFSESEALFDEALRAESTRWEDLPRRLRTMHRKAEMYRLQGRYDQAMRLGWQVLDERNEVLTIKNADTAASCDLLGKIAEETGCLDLAVPMYEQAWLLRSKIVGRDEPITQQSQRDLQRVKNKLLENTGH